MPPDPCVSEAVLPPPPAATPTVLVAFGTRPEAVKMLPVVRALRGRPGLRPLTVVTGQHREMLDQVLVAFGERADLDLDLMQPDQTLDALTGRVLVAMSQVLRERRPALVLVHGDTTTAMATALAAFYQGIPVGHVEAGLRSHDMRTPWPEEYNRVAIDMVADLLFAPTAASAANLRREGRDARAIAVTGNTGIDALLQMADQCDEETLAELPLPELADRRLILVTGHRRESLGEGLAGICEAVLRLSARDDVRIVYAMHRNPHVVALVSSRLAGRDNIHLLPAVSYPQMIALMKRAHLVMTDSGGVQEEAPALGAPVLVLREVTERPEAVAAGVACLVGAEPGRICDAATRLLDDPAHHAARARRILPYGDGRAAARIAERVERFLRDRTGRQAGAPAPGEDLERPGRGDYPQLPLTRPTIYDGVLVEELTEDNSQHANLKIPIQH